MRVPAYLFAISLAFLASCKSREDKLIIDFSNTVQQFEEQVSAITDTSNLDALMSTANTLSEEMDKLDSAELSDDQHKLLTTLSLRLNVAIMTVQQQLSNKLQKQLDSTLMDLDSLSISLPDSI